MPVVILETLIDHSFAGPGADEQPMASGISFLLC